MKKKIREVPLYDFQPEYLLDNFTEKELRQEYKRLSKYANERIKAIERSAFKESSYYKRFKGYLNRETSEPKKLAKAIVELKRFEYSPLLSVRRLYEVRRKTIASLHEEGYNFVNAKNYQQFAEFMEYAKEKVKDQLWDSERLVRFYYEHRRVDEGTLKEEFNKWKKEQK